MLATVPLDMIENGQRLRGISEAQVEALVNSIGDVGLLNPITVYRRKLYRGGNSIDGYGLVAGLHRKTACERLGLAEIEAQVLDLDDLHRQIAECDENLCAPVLSPSDRARFTSRRKDAYEALHPETRAHVAGAIASNAAQGNATDNLSAASFAADTAAKTGIDQRTVRRDAERGEKVIAEAIGLIRGTKLDTGVYLDKLKKLSPNDQITAVKRDLAADKKSARAARAKEQAKHDREREKAQADLPDEIKEMQAAKGRAIEARRGGGDEPTLYNGLPAEARIAELEEHIRVVDAENAELKASNARYADMAVLFEKGGFEAVIAAKDEEIRVLQTRLYQESADKAGWARNAKFWKKTAIGLGYSSSIYIPLDGGEVSAGEEPPDEPVGDDTIYIDIDEPPSGAIIG